MRRRRLKFSDAFVLVLQRHRAAKHLSKQALAKKAGLHQTYIGKMECGSRNPSLNAANAIALALGLGRLMFLPTCHVLRDSGPERQEEK
jgi:transcriptional regulator with XRE-family HTH domain